MADGVRIISILTVNDPGAARNGYEMVGIPDGIGLTIEGGTVVAFMNHELRSERGIVRRHGQTGAFVSRLVIDPTTLAGLTGRTSSIPGSASGTTSRMAMRRPVPGSRTGRCRT